MLISRIGLGLAGSMTKKIFNQLITHKFYNGQGGEILFNLTKRTYHIEV